VAYDPKAQRRRRAARRMHNCGTNEDAQMSPAAPLAERTPRHMRSRSLERMVRPRFLGVASHNGASDESSRTWSRRSE
jgi:hypothetical protein